MKDIINATNKIKSGTTRGKQEINKLKKLIPNNNFESEKNKGELEEEIRDSGRKGESKFVTSFISKIGKQAKNCDYFAYAELENFGIWALADGDDKEKGGDEASKIAVEEIISRFIENPTFSTRFLKKIIIKAHNKINELKEKNREKRGMSTSIVVFVTDYTSAIYANVGNTRLYLLRDDIVVKKTEDSSIAYMLYEAKELNYKDIRFHNKRNELTQAVGDFGTINPSISKIELFDGDRVLMMSHGVFENLDEDEIEVELSKTDKVGKWIGELERKIRDNSDENIPNYTLAGIFINQVAKKEKKKLNYIKYLLILLFVGIICFTFYKGYSLKREREKIYERAFQYEKNGITAVENDEFDLAMNSFEKSKNEYKELEIDPKNSSILYKTIFSPKITNINLSKQMSLVDKKIEQLQILQEILVNLNKADKLYSDNDFITAEEVYKSTKGKIAQLKDLKYKKIDEISEKIENSIVASKALTVAYKMKLTGDELLKEGNTEEAIRNYLEAKLIFLKFNKIDLLADVTEKAEKLAKMRERKYSRALLYEKKGYETESTDINSAIIYLEMAKGIYAKLGDEERRSEIEGKILRLNEMKDTLIKESKSYLNEAKAFAESGEYERALSVLKKSQDVSVQLKDNQKLTDTIQEEGDLFLANRKYKLAYEKYLEAYAISVNTNNRIQQDYLTGRIETLKKYFSINKEEVKADKLFKDGQYKQARNIYKEVINKYKVLQGDKYFEKENYDILMKQVESKYKKAKKKASWFYFF